MTNRTYVADVIEENGELMLQFPPEMLEELGWQPGDTIVWDDDEDGNIIVRKAKPDELEQQ
jgi:bifunctional DNA-binding transcriptional regulator/antitoxin component of YhaV-PrlF toxin-antitoxin module